MRAILIFIAVAAAGVHAQEVDRTLRTIDFEERRLGNPEELPMHWAKVEGAGMPHYVNGRLATERARSGKYSFVFELNGGSIIYRYDSRQVPVRVGAHFRVQTYVRTTALAHARARLTAYFVDIDRRPIVDSMRHSELYAARSEDEPWRGLQVELTADRAAQGLAIELELLQPEQYATKTLGKHTLFPQDFQGKAWFDDVTVSQVPQVRMSTDRPGNIFLRGQALSLQVLVNDRSTDDLEAQLVVIDAKGKTVFQRSGALEIAAAENLGPGQKRMRLELPDLAPGWYEAGLVMTSKGRYVGRHTLDMVLLADDAHNFRTDDRFGVIATDLPFGGWEELPNILPLLSAGRVKLAVWTKEADIQQGDAERFDRLLIALKELSITPTACLLEPPPNVMKRLKGGSWVDLLEARETDWQPQLATMIARHANHLDRWQLGSDGSEAFVRPEMRAVYDKVYKEFVKLVQHPDLAMPWPAWYELEGQLPATVALSVNGSVLPHQLPLYMQEIRKHEGHNLSLTLQLLDREQYGREVQIRDLAQRVIYALAADAKRIDLPLPFSVSGEGAEVEKQPQELFMIVRTLMSTLSGTTFRGKVTVGDGVEAFLFDRNGEGLLAIWDKGNRPGTKQLALNLGEHPRAVDLWGNVTPLLRTSADKGNQKVQLTIGSMPIFLVDIDGLLAQLRASVALDRPLIESSFMPHTRRIRFINPYKQTISGVLKLKAPEGWTISPGTFSLSVNPNETFDKEVTLEFPYNSFAGAKTILANFDFQTDRNVRLTVPVTVNLGLSDLGMQTLALRDAKDVVVQQIITNYSDRKIDYTAFAMMQGLARHERLVTNLAPGRSTIKLYRFANVPAGTNKVRVGVKELDGTRILNDEVEIR
ncbi:MAG TPA: hypothetical protein VGQ99_23350 [Tepidisphaeraceae bacterium]|nr:hypothetical protein [Tepidisphaeraceae bacterium]